jgi:hypothetical protein
VSLWLVHIVDYENSKEGCLYVTYLVKTMLLQNNKILMFQQPVLLPELLGPLLGSHLALLPGALTAPLLTAAPALNTSNHVPAPVPQILVKQGVSRCAECNIVFCKMENYMAHKKHYCSARRTEESSSPENGVVAAKSASPAPSPAKSQAATPPVLFPGKALLQYICAACGIKFTSFDNLKAHQTYYCLKRDIAAGNTASTNNNEPPPERKKCPKCKVKILSKIYKYTGIFFIMDAVELLNFFVKYAIKYKILWSFPLYVVYY